MKKSHSSRARLPSNFIECLRTHVSGFSAESARYQWGLACMLWQSGEKRRIHKLRPSGMFFSSAELERMFGRGKFKQLMVRVPLFEQSNRWHKDEGATKTYWLTPEAIAVLAIYHSTPVKHAVDLLQLKGDRMQVVRSPLAAISSTSTTGSAISTLDWGFSQNTLNKVAVNVESLQRLIDELRRLEVSTTIDSTLKPIAARYADTAVKVLRMSHTTLIEMGHMPHRYVIAPSGRLYGTGLSLQNVPSMVKMAALRGMWDYDFANCHFAIFAQMANRFGVACPNIERYLENKHAIRREIAEGAGIDIRQAKACLIALIYGAREISWRKGAIPSAIGTEAARILYELPQFKAISDEIQGAREVILREWPRTASGGLSNACGKAIAGTASDAKKLAHLLQGVEAEALRIVVRRHPDDVVLLQHDGFVSRRQLDCKTLEKAVMDQLGYRLKLEETQLAIHYDSDNVEHIKEDEIGLEVAPELDLDGYVVD